MEICLTINSKCTHCMPGGCNFRYERITPPERKEILKSAVNVFGIANRKQKAVEEMSELIKALAKHGTSIQAVQDEIVDVQIMLDQLKDIYGWNEEIEQQKLIRLKGLIVDKESGERQ